MYAYIRAWWRWLQHLLEMIILPAVIWVIFQDAAKIYVDIKKQKILLKRHFTYNYSIYSDSSDLIWWDLKMISL